MADSIGTDLAPKLAAIEAGLKDWFGRVTVDTPPQLTEAMAYSLFAPGKRLRPLLTLLACEAVGGSTADAVPAGCAVEFVHTYSLVHDDLPAMDDDDLRRGLPTSHKKFGEALAILAGDALLTAAFEVLAGGYPPPTGTVCCVELARGAGAAGMVGGQVLDLTADGKIKASGGRKAPVEASETLGIQQGANAPRSPAEELEDVHRRKTGALFRSALRMGVYAAQGPTPPVAELKAVDDFARAFGLCFQVTDDLLDRSGNVAVVGKQVRKDAARGKLTYPGLLGVDASRRLAARLAAEAEAAAATFGSNGSRLGALARFVVTRDR
jgi:geranylgeranyl diphosphate synthase type II